MLRGAEEVHGRDLVSEVHRLLVLGILGRLLLGLPRFGRCRFRVCRLRLPGILWLRCLRLGGGGLGRGGGCLGLGMNVLWFLVAGLWIFLSHVALGLAAAITIITMNIGRKPRRKLTMESSSPDRQAAASS